jgi:aspartate-semialdehyde dehydrogenase
MMIVERYRIIIPNVLLLMTNKYTIFKAKKARHIWTNDHCTVIQYILNMSSLVQNECSKLVYITIRIIYQEIQQSPVVVPCMNV